MYDTGREKQSLLMCEMDSLTCTKCSSLADHSCKVAHAQISRIANTNQSIPRLAAFSTPQYEKPTSPGEERDHILINV